MQKAEITIDKSQIMIAGSIYGLCSEASAVREALSAFKPGAVALGISGEDLEALRSNSDSDIYDSYFSNLSRFGKVSIPSPDLLASIEYAEEKDIEVYAIDINDNDFSELLYNNVSSFELLAGSRRTKMRAKSADLFSMKWDKKKNKGGFEKINKMCEKRMAENVMKLARDHRKIFVLLDLPRFDGVLSALSKLA